VEDLMDEITDQSDIGNEISQALSNPGAFGQAYDEDELMTELLEVLGEVNFLLNISVAI
jgi:charged multivesicular body protein 4C